MASGVIFIMTTNTPRLVLFVPQASVQSWMYTYTVEPVYSGHCVRQPPAYYSHSV